MTGIVEHVTEATSLLAMHLKVLLLTEDNCTSNKIKEPVFWSTLDNNDTPTLDNNDTPG